MFPDNFLRKNILVFLSAILISCASTEEAGNVDKATAHYQIGLSYYNEDKIQMAYIEFQKAIEFNPKNKDVFNLIGIIHLLNFEDYQKAMDFFKKAIKIDPKFSEAHNNLGRAYEKMGRFNDAIDAYKKAASNTMYERPEKAYNNLGRLYYRLGRYDEAIAGYSDALRRVNDFYPAYYGLALCYNAKGYYGDAATAINRAIELDPLYKGDREKAVEDLEGKKIIASEEEQKDISNFLEILRY
ncbi:MAG: tetratricopeptide repeat protein [Nitrospirota bacterium]